MIKLIKVTNKLNRDLGYCTSWLPLGYFVFPLYAGNFYTGTLENSEDPDEMQQYAAFYQGLHCLSILKKKSSRTK